LEIVSLRPTDGLEGKRHYNDTEVFWTKAATNTCTNAESFVIILENQKYHIYITVLIVVRSELRET